MPDDEVTFTIRPPPASAMAGARARISRIGAITCSSHCSCQSASVSSSSGPGRLVPALLTSAQGGPGRRRAAVAGVGSGHVELEVAARATATSDARALVLKHAGRGGADAAGAARDETHLAFETEVHEASWPNEVEHRLPDIQHRRAAAS